MSALAISLMDGSRDGCSVGHPGCTLDALATRSTPCLQPSPPCRQANSPSTKHQARSTRADAWRDREAGGG
ncbi:hypothetical protein PJP07_31320, partial [Mycobacterium kansasii]